MDFESIKNFFEERITYKAGWKFFVSDRSEYINIVLCSAPVPCAYGFIDEPQPLTSLRTMHLQFFRDEGMCRALARDMIKVVELHELAEWLKLDGKHVDDPHPGLKIPLEFKEKEAA